jgi:hypothetical protein
MTNFNKEWFKQNFDKLDSALKESISIAFREFKKQDKTFSINNAIFENFSKKDSLMFLEIIESDENENFICESIFRFYDNIGIGLDIDENIYKTFCNKIAIKLNIPANYIYTYFKYIVSEVQ